MEETLCQSQPETTAQPQNLESQQDPTFTYIPKFKKPIEDEFIDMSFLKNLIEVPLRDDKGLVKYVDPNSPNEHPDTPSEKRPNDRARCRIRFEMRTENGELVEKERNRKELKAFKLNVDPNVIPGFHYAAASMNEGETSWFRFEPQYHFGPEGVPDSIPPSTVLYFKINLDGFVNEKVVPGNDDFEGRVKLFTEIREKGNEAFQKKDYEKALKEYKGGCDRLKNTPKALLSKITEEQKKTLDDFKVKFANNAGMACLKLEQYKQGLEFLALVLAVEPKNAKAWFRKGQCLVEMGEFDEAQESFEESIKADESGRKECETQINLCKRKKGMKMNNEGKIFKKVFAMMAEEEEKEVAEKKMREKFERKREREKGMKEEEEKIKKMEKEEEKRKIQLQKLMEGTIIDNDNIECIEQTVQ